MNTFTRALLVFLSLLIWVILASSGATGAYRSEKTEGDCKDQLNSLSRAWHNIALIGGVSTGVVFAAVAFFCFKSATSIGTAVLNVEATIIGILILLWALTLLITIMAEKCKTSHTAELWSSLFFFIPGIILWIRRPKGKD